MIFTMQKHFLYEKKKKSLALIDDETNDNCIATLYSEKFKANCMETENVMEKSSI